MCSARPRCVQNRVIGLLPWPDSTVAAATATAAVISACLDKSGKFGRGCTASPPQAAQFVGPPHVRLGRRLLMLLCRRALIGQAGPGGLTRRQADGRGGGFSLFYLVFFLSRTLYLSLSPPYTLSLSLSFLLPLYFSSTPSLSSTLSFCLPRSSCLGRLDSPKPTWKADKGRVYRIELLSTE
ncbi:unnamed protein product [Protopolystoma xenopodis]|uniref:Uncharacterized protein n=1 Tax=Protopolystoma xenopodis TaxID=117903 RepID=A0A448WLR8_9PLAT|nr:unnamed protein product [Protopolystoma xenopodis]